MKHESSEIAILHFFLAHCLNAVVVFAAGLASPIRGLGRRAPQGTRSPKCQTWKSNRDDERTSGTNELV